MRMNRRDWMRFGLAGLGATGLGAAGAAGAADAAEPSAEWSRVIDAAKKEGKVFVYTAALGQQTHEHVGKAFEKRYGIDVTFLAGRASEIRERVRTEQASGRFIGDLSHNGSTTSNLQANDGAFMPFGTLPNLGRLRAPFKATELLVPAFAYTYAIMVNTRLVPPGSEPRGWKDLLDPKWKGKILSDDFRALGGGAVTFFVLEDAFGRGFHDKLAANQLIFTRDQKASERRVAQGEYAIWIPFTANDITELKGLPVKLIAPVEGMPFVAYDLALLKNAPHPNAARLLMDFFLSDEAQTIYAREGQTTVTMLPAGTALPADTAPARDGKLLGTTDASRQDEMLRLAKEIYR